MSAQPNTTPEEILQAIRNVIDGAPESPYTISRTAFEEFADALGFVPDEVLDMSGKIADAYHTVHGILDKITAEGWVFTMPVDDAETGVHQAIRWLSDRLADDDVKGAQRARFDDWHNVLASYLDVVGMLTKLDDLIKSLPDDEPESEPERAESKLTPVDLRLLCDEADQLILRVASWRKVKVDLPSAPRDYPAVLAETIEWVDRFLGMRVASNAFQPSWMIEIQSELRRIYQTIVDHYGPGDEAESDPNHWSFFAEPKPRIVAPLPKTTIIVNPMRPGPEPDLPPPPPPAAAAAVIGVEHGRPRPSLDELFTQAGEQIERCRAEARKTGAHIDPFDIDAPASAKLDAIDDVFGWVCEAYATAGYRQSPRQIALGKIMDDMRRIRDDIDTEIERRKAQLEDDLKRNRFRADIPTFSIPSLGLTNVIEGSWQDSMAVVNAAVADQLAAIADRQRRI